MIVFENSHLLFCVKLLHSEITVIDMCCCFLRVTYVIMFIGMPKGRSPAWGKFFKLFVLSRKRWHKNNILHRNDLILLCACDAYWLSLEKLLPILICPHVFFINFINHDHFWHHFVFSYNFSKCIIYPWKYQILYYN